MQFVSGKTILSLLALTVGIVGCGGQPVSGPAPTQASVETREYEIDDLVQKAANGPASMESIKNLLVRCMPARHWPEEITRVECDTQSRKLVVTQNEYGHEQVDKLLVTLRQIPGMRR